MLLMFVAYLRPGEALKVRAMDVVPPSSPDGQVALNLHPSEFERP